MPENMLRQTLLVKWTFVLMLYMTLSFGADAVLDTCKVCSCNPPGNVQTANCENRKLLKVPPNIPPTTTHLHLQNNYITDIENESFANLIHLQYLDLRNNYITDIENESFANLIHLQYLFLSQNSIKNIKNGAFENLSNLKTLDLSGNSLTSIENGWFASFFHLQYLHLSHNSIKNIKNGSFASLYNLKTLDLQNNSITGIENGWFSSLINLQYLHLSKNRIKNYGDGAFLFLRSIATIDLSDNKDMMCGCHLPAFVKYMKNRNVNVNGECKTDLGKRIPILSYSQCTNYSLFPRNLQCQTCSGMLCNDPEVTTCLGAEPLCRLTLSMNDVTLKFEKSCSTYQNCLDAMRNNPRTCNKWTDGTSCTGCCVGNSCNKNDFIGWTNSFEFHLTFKSINGHNLSVISRAMERELATLAGTFKVEYCGEEKSRSIFTIYYWILRQTTKDDLWLSIKQVFDTSQTLHALGVQQNNVDLIDGRFCNENIASLHWPATKVGTNATIPCHANVATRYCSKTGKHLEMASSQSMSSLKCSPFTGIWQEPDMSKCNDTNWITRRLKNITRQGIDQGNIDNISKEVLNISQKSAYFKKRDFDLTVDILEKMAPFMSKVSTNTTVNNTLLSINNIIKTPEAVLTEAEQAKRSVNRMLGIIETIPERISLKQQQVTVSHSNLGIGVAKVNKDTFDGLFYGVSYGTNEAEANTVLYKHSYPDLQQEDIQTTAFISIPKSLPKHLRDEERSALSRVSFFSMRDDRLFRVIQNSGTDANTTINSYVLAASVPNITINKLDEPVNISFSLINKKPTNLKCVYWKEKSELNPHWSTEGCVIAKIVSGKQVICSCDHLTSFALLMDVYQTEDDDKNDNILSIISNTGCAISFVFLVLTIIIHVCFRNLWELTASKILVSLCIPLAVSNLIFVAGMQSYLQKLAACKAVAALLHYFILTSLTWMSVEAIYVFLSTVAVFRTYQKAFMKWSSILAWGLPAVIVIITLVINYTNNYVKKNGVCWLSKIYFFATFLAPVVLILICNIIMFVLVICRLISMRNTFGHKRRKVRVFGIVGLVFLLGLPWVLAFFAVDEAAEAFKFLFTIFNTLQGLFIFMFYCICKKDTRDVITKCVFRRKRVTLVTGRRRRSGNEIEDKAAETKL